MDDRIHAYRLLVADVFQLAGASRATSNQLAQEVGQTAARWHVMSTVSERPMNVPVIARRLGKARQSVQRVVNDLVDAELVYLEPNPDHALSPLVRLSDEGDACVRHLFERSEESRSALLNRAGVFASEIMEARRVLRALAGRSDEARQVRRRQSDDRSSHHHAPEPDDRAS